MKTPWRIVAGFGAFLLVGGWGTLKYVEVAMSVAGEGAAPVWLKDANTFGFAHGHAYAIGVVSMALGAAILVTCWWPSRGRATDA